MSASLLGSREAGAQTQLALFPVTVTLMLTAQISSAPQGLSTCLFMHLILNVSSEHGIQ